MKKTRHGMHDTRIYHIHENMMQRCRCGKNHGLRGITICDEWKSNFINFYNWAIKNGYKDDLSIDRIDNDGNYCPGNCRWTDNTTQRVNQRPKINNTTGYTGIYVNRNSFVVELTFKGSKILKKSFHNLKDGVDYRNRFITENNLPHKLNKWKEANLWLK